MYICVRRSAGDPSPPWSMVQPPPSSPLWVGCGVPLPPVVWCGVSLKLLSCGLGLKVKSYKA